METSPTHDITKVILSTLRAPGVPRHSVVLRHAVDDLESGRTVQALQTLEHAGQRLNLEVFLELSRFLEKHSAHLGSAINSPAWADMMATLNLRRYRWQAMMEYQGVSQLISQVVSMRRLSPSTAVVKRTGRLTEDTPAVRGERSMRVNQSDHVQYVDQVPIQTNDNGTKRSEKQRVNYTAAAATFIVTMLVVLLWWTRS